MRAVGVHRLVLFVKDDIDYEQRELGLWSTKRLYLLSSIVSVDDLEGVLDNTADGQKRDNAVDKSMN